MEQDQKDLILRPPSSPVPFDDSPGRYTPDLGDSQETGLLEYWRILRRRRRTVFAIALAGLIAGVLVTLPQTPVYQARTSLEIQDLNQDFMNMKEVNPSPTPPGVKL